MESSKLQLKRLQKKFHFAMPALAAYENIADQFEESTGHSALLLTLNQNCKLEQQNKNKNKRDDVH